jgi:bifunctional DNA-binding transcriptional regulator/antitoxin component of YhaV-PrlF toxin-antitoxin module
MINEANFIAKIIEGERLTVPENIRTALNIKLGDLVQINIKKVTV